MYNQVFQAWRWWLLLLGSSVKFYCLMIERFHFTGTELTNLGNTWRKRQDGALLTGIIANRVLFHDEPFVLPLVRSLCLTIWLCHFSRLDVELLLNFICSERNYWSVCISGGLLTPIPTPGVSPTGPTQEAASKPQVVKVPNPLPLPLVTTASLTPETSPLGVLSPAATTAAVSMAMNGAKRALSTTQAPASTDNEPDIKRQKLVQQQNVVWQNRPVESNNQEKL